MKISQLKQPYKKMAQFYTTENKKKERGLTLGNAFNWGTCVNFNYTESHWKFWSDVEDGKSPQIPKAILDYYNKYNSKEAFQVMGMPKPVSEKPKGLTATKSYKDLVGQEIKGFSFLDGTEGVWYNSKMDRHIGKTGVIKEVDKNLVRVKFDRDRIIWTYPLRLVLEQLDAAKSPESDNQHLVGRKINAFMFKSGTNGIVYNSLVNDVLGYDGTIIAAYPDSIHVSFETRKGTITVRYPFGKDVRCSLTGYTAESQLIPEEEVQKALANMPKEPFKVGETVYLRGNAGQYKCVIDRIYFTGKPISLDAGERIVLQNKTIDGRSQPGGDIVLSRTPWCDAYGAPLDILNVEPETITEEVTIDCDLKSEEIEAGFSILQTLETVHLFADILKGVHDFTGKITPADIDYHVSLIERNLSK